MVFRLGWRAADIEAMTPSAIAYWARRFIEFRKP
jgi:hypothetical protein